MTRYTIVINIKNARWYVRDILRGRNSTEYEAQEARALALWLEDRENGYSLTDQKIRSIL